MPSGPALERSCKLVERHVDIKFCRYCGRVIPLTAVDCPYCRRNTIREDSVRPCPFCKELIRADALKCKHCGEFVGPERGAEVVRQNLYYIEKAIIAPPAAARQWSLRRPDGRPVEAERISPDHRLMAGAPGKDPALPPARETMPTPER